MHAIGNWLYWFFGIDGNTGPMYGFWSGTGSDIAEVAIFGGVIGLYRKHTCHEPRCWRIGRHPAAGGLFVLCAKHHPDIPDGGPTHEHILEMHRRHKEAV